jgi:hypothetical protein
VVSPPRAPTPARTRLPTFVHALSCQKVYFAGAARSGGASRTAITVRWIAGLSGRGQELVIRDYDPNSGRCIGSSGTEGLARTSCQPDCCRNSAPERDSTNTLQEVADDSRCVSHGADFHGDPSYARWRAGFRSRLRKISQAAPIMNAMSVAPSPLKSAAKAPFIVLLSFGRKGVHACAPKAGTNIH